MAIGGIIAIVKALQHSAPRDRGKILSVLRIYRRLEKEVRRFQKASRLACVSGCGKCCENPKIEITVLDALPLAAYLWQTGQAEEYFRKSEANHFEGQCVFYKPDPLVPGNGRCGVYLWRPLICRLFGFSAVVDKHNKCQLVTCPTIKSGQAQKFSAAQQAVDSGLPVPKMKFFFRGGFYRRS